MNIFVNKIKDFLIYLFLGSVCAPLIAYAYLGIYTRYHADDWCAQVDAVNRGVIGSLIFLYNNFFGRFSYVLFEYSGGYFETNGLNGSYTYIFIWFIILTFISFLMLNYDTKQILNSLLLSSTILFVTFDLIPLFYVRRIIDDISHTWDAYPGIFQLLYWVAVRDRIIPPLIIATILAGLIFYFAKQKDNITQKPILFFSAIILSFFACGFGETYACIQITLLGLILLTFFYFGSAKLNSGLIIFVSTILFSSLVSMVIMIIAPGNEMRLQYFHQTKELLPLITLCFSGLKSFLFNTLKWPGNILSILQILFISAYIGAKSSRRELSRNNYRIIIRLLIAIPVIIGIVLFSSFFPAGYGQSHAPVAYVMMGSIYFSVCLLGLFGYFLGVFLSSQIINFRKQNIIKLEIVLIFLFILFSFNGFRNTQKIIEYRGQLKSYAIAFDKRKEQILHAKSEGNNIIHVAKIWPFVSGPDLTADPNDWVNECLSEYYGITVIVDEMLPPLNNVFSLKQ